MGAPGLGGEAIRTEINSKTVTLKVDRISDRDIKMRDLYVRVDDLPERTLLFGQSLELPIEPGDHTIKVSNRLYRQVLNFHAIEGEVVRFESANVSKPGLLNILAFIAGQMVYKPIIKQV